MKITVKEIKAILATLPIGYYAKRRIPAELSEDAPTACYSPITDTILISPEPIIKALENLPDDETVFDKDSAVRTLLYHEVSHALLTPPSAQMDKVLNIAEDERIERTLGKYYYNVNFRKLCLYANHWMPNMPAPATPIEEFFRVVRFHEGDPALVAEAEHIMSDFQRGLVSELWNEFTQQIYWLYDKIKRKYPIDQSPDQSSEQSLNNSGDLANKLAEALAEKCEQLQSSIDVPATQDELEAFNSGAGNYDPLSIVPSHYPPATPNPRLLQQLSLIIDAFTRKTRGSGHAMCAYSGCLNPRNTKRDDYRYWDKKTNLNGANRYGSMHLNLWIDCSGSMRRSEARINTMLATIARLAKQYSNFTYSIYATTTNTVKIDNHISYIKCYGGTDLQSDIFNLWRKAQLPNTCNYNLVLFDGDACASRENAYKWGAFNHSNCTLIVDESNRRYLKRSPHAHVIVTDRYTDELFDNIITAIQIAFR